MAIVSVYGVLTGHHGLMLRQNTVAETPWQRKAACLMGGIK